MEKASTCAEEIRKALPPEELYAQLAEEAAELAQAALKMRRIITGKNPTPVTEKEARANLIEEYVDVVVCLGAIGFGSEVTDILTMFTLSAEKMKRWRDRVKEGAEV